MPLRRLESAGVCPYRAVFPQRRTGELPEQPSALLTPGKVEKYHVYLHFAGHVFQPGDKIRVDLSSADYITFFPNTNTGLDPYTDPEPAIATQRIYHGKDYPSCVWLPVLYGKL